jgi:ribonuclease-3
LRIITKILNFFSPKKRVTVKKLSHLLGYTPVNIAIYQLAFKHSSRSTDAHTSNERLEYLGDSVLGAIVAEFLFKKYPVRGEGFLTEMRSKMVNRKRLGEIGNKLNLQDFLDYDKTYVNVNSTILGNATEALIGAIYLDAGYERARIFVYEQIISRYMDLDKLQTGDINFKSRLFEWAQRYDKDLSFEVVEEKLINKNRVFVVGAYVDGKMQGKGEGRNKKDAQKEAARQVYEKLKLDSENWEQ